MMDNLQGGFRETANAEPEASLTLELLFRVSIASDGLIARLVRSSWDLIFTEGRSRRNLLRIIRNREILKATRLKKIHREFLS